MKRLSGARGRGPSSRGRGRGGRGERHKGSQRPAARDDDARGARQAKRSETMEDDIFEAEDEVLLEERHKERFDDVSDREDMMGSDFEDEEIDEDEAFDSEDNDMFGHMFKGKTKADAASSRGKSDAGTEGVDLLDSDSEDADGGEPGTEEEWDDEDGFDPILAALDGAEGSEMTGKRREGGEGKGKGHGGAGERRGEPDVTESEEGSEDEDSMSEGETGSGASGSEEEGEEGEDPFAMLGVESGSEEEGSDEEGEEGLDEETMEAVLGGAGGAKSAGRAKGGRGGRRGGIAVRDEAFPESEFTAPLKTEEEALSLRDLIGGLGDKAKSLGKARKELEKLEKQGRALSAPLPKVVADRVERKAAYDKTSKQVSEWQGTVKANREAPTLDFRDPRSQGSLNKPTTIGALATNFKPEEEGMEAEVAALLMKAKADNAKAVEEAEEALAMKELSVADAKERKERLVRMRNLMFYHEQKAKRLKKIKSKDYHKRLKKAEKMRALKRGDDDAEGDEEDAERAELARIEERLTLRHKNTSKWAKRALKRGMGVMDAGTKEAINEQLRIAEELRRKADKGGDSDSDAESTQSEGDEGGAPDKHTGMSARLKAAALDILEGNGDASEEVAGSMKGLFSLPFMKKAMERRAKEAEDMARQALAEAEAEAKGIPLDEVRARTDGAATGEAGRLRFEAGKGTADGVGYDVDGAGASEDDGDGLVDMEGSGDERDGSARSRQHKDAGTSGSKPGGRTDGPGARELTRKTDTSGYLTVGPAGKGSANKGDGSKTKRKERMELGENGGTGSAGVGMMRLEGAAGGGASKGFIPAKSFEGSRAGFVFKMGPDGLGYYPDAAGKPRETGTPKRGPVTVAGGGSGGDGAANGGRRVVGRVPEGRKGGGDQGGDGSDSEGDADGARMMELAAKGVEQGRLIQAAFAGDDVEAEFAAEKAKEVEGELPKVDVPAVMPGWGKWSSDQKEPRWMIRQREKAEQMRQDAAKRRRDAHMKNVVISEKFDKKAAQFHVESVPFGYSNKEVYEASLRQPLGRDFNTDASFRNLTRPAILKEAGVIIDPLRMARSKEEREDRGLGVKSGKGLSTSGAKRSRPVAKPLGVKRVKTR